MIFLMFFKHELAYICYPDLGIALLKYRPKFLRNLDCIFRNFVKFITL
jgi:hypothetical protein